MSYEFPTNLCTDCRDSELVSAEEKATRLCITCWQDQSAGEGS